MGLKTLLYLKCDRFNYFVLKYSAEFAANSN